MKLDEYIKDKEMSEAAFAKLADINQPTINRYVRGSRFPTPENLIKIKSATGGKVSWKDWETAYIPKPTTN